MWFRKRLIVCLSVAAAVVAHGRTNSASAEDSPLTDDVKRQIDRVLAFSEGRATPDQKQEWDRVMADLYTLAPDEPERLLPQLVWYQTHVTDADEPRQHRMAMLIDTVRMSARVDRIIEVVVPYLKSKDSDFQREMATLMGRSVIDRCRNVNWSYFHSYLRQRSSDEAGDLIAYLYEGNPGIVLAQLGSVYIENVAINKGFALSNHIVEDYLWKQKGGYREHAAAVKPQAIEELMKLASRDEWWVRMYVAAMLGQNTILRDEELITTLIADPNETVRSMVLDFVTSVESGQTSDKVEAPKK
jgi:hypothetical protein